MFVLSQVDIFRFGGVDFSEKSWKSEGAQPPVKSGLNKVLLEDDGG